MVYLNPEQRGLLLERVARSSVVQALGRKVEMGHGGASVTTLVEDVDAQFVAERGKKPVTDISNGTITLVPKKIAAITTVSKEQARDIDGIIEALITKGADAFAKRFDAAALHGVSSPFSTSLVATSKEVTLGTADTVYLDVVEGLRLVTADDKELTGFAWDSRAEAEFLGAVDNAGRPLFTSEPYDNSVLAGGRLLGRPAFMGRGVGSTTVAGFGGDFSKVLWGQAGEVEISIAKEASLEINGQVVSLFQHNMVGILIETEYAFAVADEEAFVKYNYAGTGDDEEGDEEPIEG